jgi:hypothetical protein
MLGGAGAITAIDATGDVVSVADPLTPPKVAVMVVEPTAAVAVASPFDPGVLLMVAIPVSVEAQVTDDVNFCLPLLEYVPVAVNCTVVSGAMLGSAGVTERESSTGVGASTSSTPHPTSRDTRISKKHAPIDDRCLHLMAICSRNCP